MVRSVADAMTGGRFGAAFAGILIAAVLSCAAGPAAAQTTTLTYVSNTGQGDTGNISGTEFAQNFTTGDPREGGYPLTSVEVVAFGSSEKEFSVSVCSVNSDSEPTSVCTALTPPDSFGPVNPQLQTLVFTATEDIVLMAGTTYALRIVKDNFVGRFSLGTTSSQGEDEGGSADWSIENGLRYTRPHLGDDWFPRTESARVAIKHTIRAPTAADNTIATPEDMAYAFGAGDFNFSGVDMDDTLAGMTLVTLPANGTLTLDGTAVTADQTVTRVDINAGKLRYTPPANANGPGYASFTFKVRGSSLVSDDAYAMTIDVTAVNDAATGTPVIFGDAVVDRTLTAGKGDIADVDALPATFPDGYTFQWVRVDADGMSNPADIGGATSGVYTLTTEDVGKRVKVRVSVTDEAGTRELRESEPTAEVAATDNNDTTAPTVVSIVRQSPMASPTNADSLTWRVAFSEPVQDMDAADFTVSGTTALPTSVNAVPGSPSQHDVTVSGGDLQNAETTVLLAFAGGHGIADTAGNPLVNTAPTWTNDNTFVVDNTAPTLTSGSVVGASVTLTFSEALDAGLVPGADAFEATVAGSPAALAGTGAVALDGRVVTLTLASPALMRRAVRLTYTPPTGPGATPLRDVAGNGVARIERRTIPNVTPHGPPANLMARVGDRTVRLVWEKPAGEDAPDIGYEFRYAAAPSVPTETGWIRGNRAGVTTVQALGLANGTSYAFEVRAVDTDGAGAPAAVAATPAPAVCNAPDLGATRRQIWSGMVEVGSLYYYATQGADHGFDETWAGFGNDNILRQFGRLTSSDRNFSIGDHSNMVRGIVSVTNGDGRPGSLFLRVLKTLPEAVKSVLSLHWCDQSSGVFLYTSLLSPAIDFRYIATDRGETDFSLYRTLAVALSLPPNNDATGTPEVSGTASVGETLTAAIGDIADADGLPTTFPDDYTFQWVRVDADGASNPVEIADATASAYTLTDDDVGKRVKARISFSDQLDGAEVRDSAPTAEVSSVDSISLGICGRTAAVQTAIIAKIPGISECGLVTDEHLAAITELPSLNDKGITALAAGDFAGLTALTRLDLNGNRLTALPTAVFDDLTALTGLSLEDNQLTGLPPTVFAGLTALTRLDLNGNGLTALPAAVFDDLTALTGLWLYDNMLTTLPAGVFDDLTALTTLNLRDNGLAALPDGVFEGLNSLEHLFLNNNGLAALPAGVFEELTSLERLYLATNPGAPFAPPPVALPDDGTVPEAGGTVTLDGSGSGGAWGANVTYLWALTAPTDVTVSFGDAASVTTTVTIPPLEADTELVFTLTVTGRGSTHASSTGVAAGTDTATVTVIDAIAPTVTSIVRHNPSSSPTNADTLTWRVTFSEAVENVDTADFTVAGTTAGATLVRPVAGMADVAYDVTASGGNLNNRNATVTLSFAANQDIVDANDNALENTTPSDTNERTYALDNTAPTVTITGVPNPSSAAFTATFTFLEPVTGFAVGAITLGNATASNFAVTSTTVYTALITPTAEAAFTVDVAANVATDAAGNGNTAAVQVSSTYSIGICPRTQQVRDAILGKISGVTNCALVTDLHLAAVSGTLDLYGTGIPTLQSGDFDGLSALTTLRLENNRLAALPSGVFDGLSALTTLELGGNGLAALPAGVFDDLGALTYLRLTDNDLTELPAGVFDDLGALTRLTLDVNSLAALPAGVFDDLGALTTLDLNNNRLAALPAGVFDGLSALTELWLNVNILAALPAGVFDGLSALTELYLHGNSLAALPAGVFDDLGALTLLQMNHNGLAALPAGVFDDLGALTRLRLDNNSLAALPDGVFDDLGALTTLHLSGNSGAPFAPTAVAAPANPATVLPAGGTVTLAGSAPLSGNPWGANVAYEWALTNPIGVTVTFDDAMAATTMVTIPPQTAGTVLTFTLDVAGRASQAASRTATTTVTVTETPTVTLALSDASISENGAASTVTATVSPASATAFTVTVSAAAVSPALPADFNLSPNKLLSFATNATASTGTVTITSVNNDVDAADKTVTVSGAVTASGVTAPAAVTLTIEDDDADSTAPTVTSIERQTPAGSPTNADTLTWRVTFSEPVTGVDTADFMVAGTTAVATLVSAVTGTMGAAYDVTVSGGNLDSRNATVTLSFAAGQNITDAASNALANTAPSGTNHNTYALDNIAPRVVSLRRFMPLTSPTNADDLTWHVGFDVRVSNVDATDFMLTGTNASLTVSQINAVTHQVVASGGDLAGLTGTVTLSFASGHDIVDQAGNRLTNTAPTLANEPSYRLDNTAPTLSSAASGTAGTQFTLTFSEDVQQSNLPLATAFTVTADGNAVTVDSVAASAGTQILINVSPAIPRGQTVVITYTDPSAGDDAAALQDLVGNDAETFTTGMDDVPAAVNNSAVNAVPTLATAIPNQAATTGTAFSYTFLADTFSDANGDTLTYMATKADVTALPTWLDFTDTTRTFSGTPQAADVATVAVKVTASDGNGGSVSDTFNIVVSSSDTPPPTVTSIERQTPASTPTNADTLIWRVTFSEPVLNVDTTDFTVSGTTATVTAVSAAAGVAGAYDVTASGGNLNNRNATVTLSFAVGQNITDAASNALADTAPTGANEVSYVLDNTAPTVTITGVPNPSSAAFTATFTFLEPVTGFAVGGITLGNATASNFLATSTTVYTALITPTADGTVTVDVPANAAQDAVGNGNPAATRASSTYTLPAITIAAITSPVTEGAFAGFTLTRTGNPAEALEVAVSVTDEGGVISGTPPISVTFGANASTASLLLSIADDAVDGPDSVVTLTLQTGSGYAVGGAASATVTVTDNDTRGVTIFIFSRPLAVYVGGTNTYMVVLDSAPTGDVTIAPSSDNTEVTVSPETLSFTAENWNAQQTVTVTAAQNAPQGSVTITHAVTGEGTDYASVSVPAFSVTVTSNDTIAPTVTSIARQTPSSPLTNADELTWRVTFSEAVTGVDTADFTVAGTTAVATLVIPVTGMNDLAYDVTVSGGDLASLDATATLSFVTAHGIVDEASNALSNTTPTGTNHNTYALDNTAPRVASLRRFMPLTSPTNADDLTWHVGFDVRVSNVDAADFMLTGTNVSLTVSQINAVTHQVVASGGDLASLTGTVTLSFASGHDIQDQATNRLTNTAPTVANEPSYVLDNTVPTLTSAVSGTAGTQFALTFSEDVQQTNLPLATAFTVTADGNTVTVNSVAASAAAQNLINVSPAIPRGQTVVIAYTDPSAGDDAAALQDLVGNDAETFTTGMDDVPAAVNNSAVNAVPTLATAIPNQATTTGTAFNYAFPSETFSDANGDTLTYTAKKSDDTVLPTWLTFAATTRAFSGTPQAGDVGTVAVKVTANDGDGGTVSDTFNIVVRSSDATAPTVTSIVRHDPTSTPTNANTLIWRVTFSEPVMGVDATDFTVAGTTATAMTASAVVGVANAYDITVSGGDLASLDATATLSFVTAHGIVDEASNALSNTTPTGTNHNTYALDNTAPRVASLRRFMPLTSPTNADDLTWHVGFDVRVSNVDAADFMLTGTNVSLTVSQINAVTHQVVASGGDLASLTGTVTLSFASGHDIQDQATNRLTNTAPTVANEPSYVLDNTVPTLTSAVSGTAGTQFALTFSEDVQQSNLPLATAFTVTADGNTVTVNSVAASAAAQNLINVSPAIPRGQTVVIAYTDPSAGDDAAALQDLVGNDAETFTTGMDDVPAAVNNSAVNAVPTLATAIPNQAATTGTAFNYAFPSETFSDANGDTLTYTAKKSDDTVLPTWLTFAATTRAFSGTPQAGDVGTVAVKVTANDGDGGTVSDTFNIVVRSSDATAPTVTSIVRHDPTSTPTNANTLIWRVTFSEPVMGVDATDFTVAGTTATAMTASAVVGVANAYDISVSGGDLASLDATATLSFVTAHGIVDEASNALSNTTPTGTNHNTYALDNTAPRVASLRRFMPLTSPTNADDLTWHVGFDVRVSNVDAADFMLTGTNVSLTVSQINAVTHQVVASGGDLASLTGTVTLSFASGHDIQDQATNRLTNTAPTVANEPSYVLDNTVPTLSSAVSGTAGTQFALTFSEDVQQSNLPLATAFTVTADGNTVTVNSVAASAAAQNLINVSPAIPRGQTVVITYTDPSAGDDAAALQDLVGNDAETFTTGMDDVPAAVNNSAVNAVPTLATAIPNQAATTGTAFSYTFLADTFSDANGDTLTYMATKADVTALPTWLDFTDTTRTFSGTPQAADVATVAVKVTASDGNGGSVSDTFNIVVSAVANTPPGLVTAQVDGETLTLTYNEPLDTGSEPAPGDFSVSVAAQTVVVSGVALSGSALTLTLAVAVVNRDSVTVTYTPGSNPIQDLAGNDAAAILFPVRVVDNVTVSPPGAPGRLAAIAGNGQVSLGWAAPSVTGGAAIVGYAYRVSLDGGNNWSPDWTAVPDGPDTGSDAADERAYVVTGLTNGTAYTFEVRASNSTHSGPAAQDEATPQTGPAADPDAPRGFAARAGDAAVTLNWQAPLNTGNRPLLRYEVRYAEGSTLSASVSWQDAGAVLTYTVAGLTNGRQHTFEVRAVNTADRAGAAARAQATPEVNADVPGPVRSLRAAARNFEVALYWHTPAREGLTAITHYEFRYARGSGVPTGAAWVRVHDTAGNGRAVDGLENGVAYTFEVRAVNATGAGALAQVRATPGEPALRAPGAPGNLRAVSGAPYVDGTNGIDVVPERAYVDVTLSWDAPTDDGDDPVFRYETRHRAGSAAWTAYRHVEHREGPATTVKHLTPGTRYTFELRAVNEVGPGTAASRQLTTARYTGPALTLQAGGSAREGEPFTLRATRSGSTAADTYVFFELYDSAFPNGYRGGTPYHHEVAYFNGATATASYTPPFDGTRAGRTFTVRISSVSGEYDIAGGLVTVSVADRDAGLSVADTSVREGTGATLEFVVRLDRARDGAVTVDYATSAGSATAGLDYTEVSGTLSIPAGSRRASIEVAVLDDEIDDDGETLTLTLSNADGAFIEDGVATGTIHNTDALPKAWLGRFGRSAAVQVVTLLDERFEAAAASDTRLTLGSRAVDVAARRTAAAGEPARREQPAAGCSTEAGKPQAPRAGACDTTDRAPLLNSAGAGPARYGEGAVRLDDQAGTFGQTGANPVHPADRAVRLDDQAGAFGQPGADPVHPAERIVRLDDQAGLFGQPGTDPVRPAERIVRLDDQAGTFGQPGVDLNTVPGDEAAPAPAATPLERALWTLLTQRGRLQFDKRQFISQSSFEMSLNDPADSCAECAVMQAPDFSGRWSLWGRGALMQFSGQDNTVNVRGDVLTGLLGVDYARARWLAGAALAYHDGDGSYSSTRDGGTGALDSVLVTVNPYLRYALTQRLSVWGTLGYGAGALTLRQSGGPDAGGQDIDAVIETDLRMGMGALGLRGVVYAGEHTEWALKSDALWVRTSSAETAGMRSAGADTSRLRLLLSGQHQRALANDALLSPGVELGLRYDDGDAETGLGLELGAGLRYADSVRGLIVETKARALLAHEDGAYEEWGLSGSLSLDPGRLGRGLALRLDSGWGVADSGAEALWQRQTTAGIAPQHDSAAQQRITAEMGYGLDVPWTAGILTPYSGVEWAGSGRTLRLGWRFALGQRLSLSLDGERKETGHTPPEHALMLRTSLPW